MNVQMVLRPVLFGFLLLLPNILLAEGETGTVNPIDKSDTTWMLVSSALVFFMIPGLSLFYGGIVRSKNVLSTMMHSFVAMIVMTLQWTIFGYSFAFSGENPYIGNFDLAFLDGIDLNSTKGSIPTYVHFLFQGMFALITPALISGAIAERIKLSAYILFILVWSTLVYDPVAHWVWADSGWLFNMNALDFAGGTVVHLISGIAGLSAAIVIGKRKGDPGLLTHPNNMTYTLLGSGLLWFGWFGFNAGSGLAVNGLAARAFLVTLIAPAAAGASWLLIEWYHTKKATALGAASGIVAGLVVITPASGFVGIKGALIMGVLVSPVCYLAILLKGKLKYDDTLDAFGIHGAGGALGAILTGIFALELAEGMTFESQMIAQLISVIATGFYSFVVSYILALIIERTIGFRIEEDKEITGLDQEIHGEKGYDIR
ncbi:ammonium transporter [Leptospira biflexa]|uniref:Ammonium transporter n=1 Tax=Leptospira biflexa serovar Patoc (strain Patoc 1 / ATCC 23582 / Paris) TaxID=456481 RepID=B0SLB7_LEPBP|nr:Ammonia permease [Leptospira biflexa serovar Patoc strain 'Patoc 1 (Ames)']ABZ96924.1 Ammonia channel (Ammonia transporter) [Leptospira biflexa serovar Patoc strain 'Patoc 1 (Paris)']TGM38191.1 ammonium transporter [Leptospira biflexa]TGM41522.1 ammonium transporter [Leptospira biflexa]TGM47724.1 ammonium transporter [Leptospira biflexa]